MNRKMMTGWLGALVLAGWGAVTPAGATLLVRYSFDEASSGTTTALNSGSLGSAADGVFSGNATRTGSTPNNYSLGALDLNTNGGNDDYVGTAGDPAGLDLRTAMSLTTWINVQANNAQQYSPLASDLDAGQGWEFYYERKPASSSLDIGFQVNGSAVQAGGTPVSAGNTWVFVAATWDGSTVKFYSGTPGTGVAQVGLSQSLSATMLDNTVPMRVGWDPAGSFAPAAYLDDFRVYDTALDLTALNLIWADNLFAPEPSVTALLLGGALLTWNRRGRSGRKS